MDRIRLGTLTRIRTGKLDANASSENGEFPFFTCAMEPLKIDAYSYDCECVLVAGNGDLNVKYYDGKFDAYQRTYIIESTDKERIIVPYIYYFLESYIDTLRGQSIGGIIKYIKLANLTDAQLLVPSVSEQKKIVSILESAKAIIHHYKIKTEKLDELVKARFVEMFGDPEQNTKNFPICSLGNLCKVGSSKRIYQNEQSTRGIPFLRISDLNEKIDKGIDTAELFIPFEKYMELKKQGLVPTVGDILVTSRGTLGKCYIVKETDEFYFQDGMISWISRMNDSITSLYITYLFAMPGIRKQIINLQGGSTVAYLSIAMLKKLDVMLPPLELQQQFAVFVEQVNKSKVAVQKALDEAQLLFDSLMQEYFG